MSVVEHIEKKYVQRKFNLKEYEEIFLNLLEHAYDNGLISHNEHFLNYIKSRRDISSFYVMTLSILADSIEDVYFDMNDVYLSSKVLHALGTDLDDIGEAIGCPRPQATHSAVQLTFTLHQIGEGDIVKIPKNTMVSNHRGVTYITVDDAIIPLGERSVNVYAESMDVGRQVRVGRDTLTVIESDLDYSFSVTNPISSSGGDDVWGDDDYRDLLLLWVKNRIKGSEEAYIRYFADADGIESYNLIPNYNNISGTVKVVIDPGFPEQLQQVYNDIKSRVCQLDEDIIMASPTQIPINVYARCNVDIDVVNPYSKTEKEDIRQRIIEAIKIFINGGTVYVDGREQYYIGLILGEDFIPYQLGVFLKDNISELMNITFYSIDPSNGKEVESLPVTITDEEIGIILDEHIHITME